MLTKTTKTKLQKESERKQKLQKLISLKIKKKVKLGEQWEQVHRSTILILFFFFFLLIISTIKTYVIHLLRTYVNIYVIG